MLNKHLNSRFPLLSQHPVDSAIHTEAVVMVKFLFVEIKERG